MAQFFLKSLTGIFVASVLVGSTPLFAATQLSQGKVLYDQYCAFCHGADGLADTPVGRILEPRPRRFADPIEMARVTDDQIYYAIKDGIVGSAMASWGKLLTEPQIGSVIDYLHQLEGKTKPLNESQLSLEVGRRIYDKECAFCHGLTGHADTDAARVLRPPPIKFADAIQMARIDDGRLYAAIKLGKPGTAMASWANLMTPVEIIDVMRYVRSLQEPLPEGMTSDRLDVTVGGKIYQRYCLTCHGTNGDANTPLGQVLAPRPRDFTDKEAMAKLGKKDLIVAIRKGKPGTAMAPWGGILNTDDIERVVRYIRASFSP